MNAKMILSTLAIGSLLTAAAAPAFADPPRWAPAHGYRHHHDRVVVVRHSHPTVTRTVIVREPVVVRRTVVVERPVYVRPPIVVHRPVYYAAPVYPAPANGVVLGTLGGALIGAAIGSQSGHPGDQAAGTVIGAVIGGVIGSQAARY
jgi:uncharacterized protein YcfJ